MTTAPKANNDPGSRRVYNSNYIELAKAFYIEGKRGCVLEGGSRSGKTWSAITFLMDLCLRPGNPKGQSIFLIKETYNSFKTTLYDDFNKLLPRAGVASPFDSVKDVQSFWLGGNKISLIGGDQPSKFHSAGCDFFYVNEALDVDKSVFDQLEMRCRKFWFVDYNPKHSIHWVFDMEKRDDVKFFRSTLLDNPMIGRWEKKKILSYDPNNPTNVEAGTADDYMWAVYGLGKRASPTGLVFPNVTWIETFPDDIELITYGLDFGYTNSPTALVKVGRNGMNLYVEKLAYAPVDNAPDLSIILQSKLNGARVWADPADPIMIADLRRRGISISPAVKGPGSIEFGINFLKGFKLHLVNDADLRKEQENYKWREINGIRLNEPVDDFNHAWDATRYCSTMQFRTGS